MRENIVKSILDVSWATTRQLFRQQGLIQAAALAFYALLSFIPLMFLLVAMGGLFLGSADDIHSFLLEKIAEFVPWYHDILKNRLSNFIKVSKGLSIFSIFFIFWSCGIFFTALQKTLTSGWPEERKHQIKRWRFFLPWIAGPFISLFLISLMILSHTVGYLPLDRLNLGLLPQIWTILGLSLVFFVLYTMLIPVKNPPLSTFIMSLLLSVASQAITWIFTSLLWKLPNYSLVYGSLSSTVLFLLWLNYNMALILWGGLFLRNLTYQRQTRSGDPTQS